MPIGWPFRKWVPPVLVDEGGIRHSVEGIHRYLPFVTIANVTPYPRALARDLLGVTTDAEYIEVTAPMGADGKQLALDILERSRRARATQAAARARRGQLASWVATVAAKSTQHDAYRACSVDADELERVFANPAEENEARAAAAHALLARDRAAVVAPRITRLSPPLVVAAVRLAKDGASIVTDALLDEVLPFLELRDRVVFRQRLRRAA